MAVTKIACRILIPLLAAAFSACSQNAEPEIGEVMGTIAFVNLYENGNSGIYSRVFEKFLEIENILSPSIIGSNLDTVNRNAGIQPVKASRELLEVLEAAVYYAEKSGGSFDPTIGPLVNLWGIGTDAAKIPSDEEIRAALDLVNYRDVEIDAEEGTVFLRRPGMALDLGAIGKGYAVDEAVSLLSEIGVKRGIINLGGEVFAIGERQPMRSLVERIGGFFKRPDDEESYWRVGVQDPAAPRGIYSGIIKAKNLSVLTSGTYERFFEEDGKRYHHIFSVETGFPVDNGILSVTVTAERAVDAEALSTAAFVLGWERGRNLIASVPGAEGVFIFDDGSIRITEGMDEIFALTSPAYRLLR